MASGRSTYYAHNRAKPSETDADILLVGINYDTDTKLHTCTIERWKKDL